ncbi:MAG: hypothetical protein KZQ66_03585 [Candidatus Thiodiazotropha sp. (ex Lucinoma aequizonata)]|nr:hypothetical protein [Candidatus Thiodiazotropha sp. (ex Lucinoma aequizonata)]MCU7889907.1 hypothetical protein [Candidatus Thiodiazotropha sp. (ex Lucinoma aequizonata)]MCU7894410.1 hypothetical protein [Candidatus Thiodiazotropha sp. (ex Lucinoma aequizonata)]MCU7899818.1 hypothetical protein [Candidatus Thiodiazotropha sp. (ex Lucinoma aequizonata)]MCU7901198.1 hypothetical protein [Candidatus Thiodiazotropha sp. (ex Lucinoma aequizonata)]
MLDTINAMLRFLLDYPAIFFAGLGYFNGYLFRDINLYKIFAMIFVVPYCMELLININWVYLATLPFLICSVIGYWGIDKSKHRAMAVVDLGRELIGR